MIDRGDCIRVFADKVNIVLSNLFRDHGVDLLANTLLKVLSRRTVSRLLSWQVQALGDSLLEHLLQSAQLIWRKLSNVNEVMILKEYDDEALRHHADDISRAVKHRESGVVCLQDFSQVVHRNNSFHSGWIGGHNLESCGLSL